MEDYNLDFLEIKFIKHHLFALVQNNENYLLLTGRVLNPKLEINSDTIDILGRYNCKLSQFTFSHTAAINIPFIAKDDALFHLITLHNKEEYKTILEVAEVIL